jgi:hypothetical protein
MDGWTPLLFFLFSSHLTAVYGLTEISGKHCFDGRSLHHLGDAPNPYEQAIGIIGRTLSAYDEDNRIPCFGFGDSKLSDSSSFHLCKLRTRESCGVLIWFHALFQHQRTIEASSTSTEMVGRATEFQKHCSDTERSPLTFGSLVSWIFDSFSFLSLSLSLTGPWILV